ncbi:hypothetical protein LSH36_155g03000, partial [Paralvinella palmiformis]
GTLLGRLHANVKIRLTQYPQPLELLTGDSTESSAKNSLVGNPGILTRSCLLPSTHVQAGKISEDKNSKGKRDPQGQTLHVTFLDLNKAFERGQSQAILKSLITLGFKDKLILSLPYADDFVHLSNGVNPFRRTQQDLRRLAKAKESLGLFFSVGKTKAMILHCRQQENINTSKGGISTSMVLSLDRALIKTVPTYSAPCRLIASLSSIDRLDVIQIAALRIALGLPRPTPTALIYTEAGDLPIKTNIKSITRGATRP